MTAPGQSDSMPVRVLTGMPGCGKTTTIRTEAIEQPGPHLFAFPTIPLIREQMTEFRSQSPGLDVQEAHSRDSGHGPVSRRLAAAKAAVEAKGCGNSVVLTTHAGLMSPDLPDFSGWHIYVDEAPEMVRSGVIKRALDNDALAANFDLEPVGSDGWSQLRRRTDGPGWQAFREDTLAQPLMDFWKLAFSDAKVFVRATAWTSLRALDWFSLWTPLSLRGAASVTFAGAALDNSLGFKVLKRAFGDSIDCKLDVLRPPRPGCPSIRIHYFTSGHEGTTTFWQTSEGRLCLNKVVRHLREHAPHLGFWSANDVATRYLEHWMPGELAKPKSAGLNGYRGHTSCALLYSSKPLEGDRPIQEIFGITRDELLACRESEDILQFVFRGAIRGQDFDGAYDIYLYSRRQAEVLRDRLIADAVVAGVDLVALNSAGIMDVDRPIAGPIPHARLSVEERRARDRERKGAKRRAKAIVLGTHGRKPGRPPKPGINETVSPELLKDGALGLSHDPSEGRS